MAERLIRTGVTDDCSAVDERGERLVGEVRWGGTRDGDERREAGDGW